MWWPQRLPMPRGRQSSAKSNPRPRRPADGSASTGVLQMHTLVIDWRRGLFYFCSRLEECPCCPMPFIRKCRIPTGASPTSASSTTAAGPSRPSRWRCCRSRGATGSATPSAPRARRRTMYCSQCWQASRRCAAPAWSCASRPPGASRWCCGWRRSASPGPASRRRWRPCGGCSTSSSRSGGSATRSGARPMTSAARRTARGRPPFPRPSCPRRSWRPTMSPPRWSRSSAAIRAACCCGATGRRPGSAARRRTIPIARRGSRPGRRAPSP